MMRQFFKLFICWLMLVGCGTVKIEHTIENPSISTFSSHDLNTKQKQNDNTFKEDVSNYIFSEMTKVKELTVEEKIDYLALGDSLTRGVGDEEKKNGYTKRLAEKIENWNNIQEVAIDNRGKRGRRSDQLLKLLQKGHYDKEIKDSELITITIGGNDMMKVVKEDIFDIKRESFDKELVDFQQRYNLILNEIRNVNPYVPIILIGLYNPLSIINEEIKELDTIIEEWNHSIELTANMYNNACYVGVADLFEKNANLVYHSDFFHPNGYGYTMMTERIVSMIKSCQIKDQSSGLILFN